MDSHASIQPCTTGNASELKGAAAAGTCLEVLAQACLIPGSPTLVGGHI